jgi:hypothetical protein
MSEHAIQSAALDAADRIMDLVARFIPETERAAVWSRVLAEVQARIVAVVGAEREERLSPSKN